MSDRGLSVPPEPDTRGEIDLAGYARRLAARWWIVVLCVVLAVGIALLRDRGGRAPQGSSARALVNIGVPLSPTGVPIVGSVASNPLYASILVHQRANLDAAARAAGVPVARLTGNVTVQVAGGVAAGTAARTGASIQMYVIVAGRMTPAQAAAAGNSLADALVRSTSGYQTASIRVLQTQIRTLQQRNAALGTQTAVLQRQIGAVEAQRGLTPLERIAATNAATTIITTNGNTIAQNTQLINSNTLLLLLEQQVAQSSVLSPAVGARLGGGGGGSGVVAAAFVGLIVGVLLALASTLVRPPPRA